MLDNNRKGKPYLIKGTVIKCYGIELLEGAL